MASVDCGALAAALISLKLDPTTCCDGDKIRCFGGRINSINLPSLNIEGTLDPLVSLTSLNYLNLRYNKLTGGIPAGIAALPISYLSIANNQLTGGIPPEIGNMIQLTQLGFDENQLTGPIPPELGKLRNLNVLGLSHNGLSGEIPPSFGGLSELTLMALNYNGLTGTIPDSFRLLHKVNMLDHNHLTGPIPDFIATYPLTELWLTGNCFSTGLPPGIDPKKFPFENAPDCPTVASTTTTETQGQQTPGQQATQTSSTSTSQVTTTTTTSTTVITGPSGSLTTLVTTITGATNGISVPPGSAGGNTNPGIIGVSTIIGSTNNPTESNGGVGPQQSGGTSAVPVSHTGDGMNKNTVIIAMVAVIAVLFLAGCAVLMILCLRRRRTPTKVNIKLVAGSKDSGNVDADPISVTIYTPPHSLTSKDSFNSDISKTELAPVSEGTEAAVTVKNGEASAPPEKSELFGHLPIYNRQRLGNTQSKTLPLLSMAALGHNPAMPHAPMAVNASSEATSSKLSKKLQLQAASSPAMSDSISPYLQWTTEQFATWLVSRGFPWTVSNQIFAAGLKGADIPSLDMNELAVRFPNMALETRQQLHDAIVSLTTPTITNPPTAPPAYGA